MAADYRVGTSGWSYNHWREVFYPEGLSQARWFEHYSQHFDTVELNATYYRLMPERTFQGWRDKAPEGFLYAVKMWQQVTHRKVLKDVGSEVGDFLKRAALLGDHLGPILVQLPPRFGLDLERLERFLPHLSAEFEYAFEFRNPSWFTEKVYDILRERGIALCVFHHVKIECPRVATAPLVYLRFHGESGRYTGKYTTEHLKEWADLACNWIAEGRRVVAYFNNDYKGYAVENAIELRRLIEAKLKRKSSRRKKG